MPSFDSIVVGEDWISEHYFTTDSVKESFHGRVMELRKAWDAEAKEGRATVRSTFLFAARDLQTGLASLAENPEAAAKVHAGVRAAFGHDGDLADFIAERAGAELRIPDAQLHGTPNVLFLQAGAVDTLEALLDPETGRLITPATEDGKPLESVSKAVSAAFRSDTPPAFVVVQAGQWHLLAEAQRWAEGRYLAVDLLVVTERRHEARGGEIDRCAAIFGHQALKPDADGSIWWTGVLEDSVKHTIGVSKTLREGIRLSIEIIANEVVNRRRERGLIMDGIDGNELAKHSLRFLYRILFLLYAEASPEMQVLPTGAAEYEEGYGLNRLRELTLTELTSHRARTGTHLYESLKKLFDLVDRGHIPTTRDNDGFTSLQFNPLRADLFLPKSTALIDEVGLGNEATQAVLEHLLLSKESKRSKGADRGFISYAELGINQLGAVYEGLMAYTGFFAGEDLYEVAKDGNPEKGSWVVPAGRHEHLDPADFVRKEDPDTHEPKPVVHKKGTFVFRLAGRERQQSASYYTPEILTKFVVSQALDELLDQDGHRTTPEEILQLTICEPALGSGAFAIEAVRQLAGEYLKRKQEDLGQLIEADTYPVELQKVKAHIALHQVYGVDLNATAVELAEISLWLDTMVAGLQAPWFGLHLRRGNSLIGTRRAVYQPGQLAKRAWLKALPKDIPLGEEIGAGIHHFLLPAEGWGAVIDTAEAKTYAPEKREELRLWRNEIRKSPSKDIVKRLARLAQRVEILWKLSLRRLIIAESAIRRDLHLWGRETVKAGPAVPREQIEAMLRNENGAYGRIRRVMDAWCALWSWPVITEVPAPGWDQWVGGLEAILGVPPKVDKLERHGQISIGADLSWYDLDFAEHTDQTFARAMSMSTALETFPWLKIAARIAVDQGFHHWELDFAPVLNSGGFDLQVGNPPWVRPDWSEAAVLAEFDPWWGLFDNQKVEEKNKRRALSLDLDLNRDQILYERSAHAGMSTFLGSATEWPLLSGVRTDLYRCFMEKTWRSMSNLGAVGLVHPDGHFTDPKASILRKASYRKLRRHWHFKNELKLFEIGNKEEFAVHVYRKAPGIDFLHAASLYQPDTVTRSLDHDGSGDTPGVKDPAGQWDIRPHRNRIIRVTVDTLQSWATMLDESDAEAARMVYLIDRASIDVLIKLSTAPRLSQRILDSTPGWNETNGREAGRFHRESRVPQSWQETILQGFQISTANPLYKQPNTTMASNRDTTEIPLDRMSDSFIPRTSYQLSIPYEQYIRSYSHWNGVPTSEYFRLSWREMSKTGNARTLQAAILCPGPQHLLTINSAKLDWHDLAIAAGFASSLIADYLMKVSTKGHINTTALGRIPHVRDHKLESKIILRALRLNCLIREYAPLWESEYNPSWMKDSWTSPEDGRFSRREPIGEVTRSWSPSIPLRRAGDRRQAIIEIDAIVAVMLGISADELVGIYTSQFPVLRKYDRETLYDNQGLQLPAKIASTLRRTPSPHHTDFTENGIVYAAPFSALSREYDMRIAHGHFTKITADGV
ncbi:Eco57I restriction-modification methylase domain-containing protein [Nocardia sp. NPDC057227]|uniref:Eco57I restriction-modification methylase domain-containing protein n=1 Tax=Nocardia sp. NPDC057227 TaxID=3346056 RepID=UPI0036438F68